mmetsp:Transcript_21027/g.47444  ORF Transcript_21027/g.47444 Transcript_21027/m.47444 type:complete len:244 (+) Transcript_21027:115-846(+)
MMSSHLGSRRTCVSSRGGFGIWDSGVNGLSSTSSMLKRSSPQEPSPTMPASPSSKAVVASLNGSQLGDPNSLNAVSGVEKTRAGRPDGVRTRVLSLFPTRRAPILAPSALSSFEGSTRTTKSSRPAGTEGGFSSAGVCCFARCLLAAARCSNRTVSARYRRAFCSFFLRSSLSSLKSVWPFECRGKSWVSNSKWTSLESASLIGTLITWSSMAFLTAALRSALAPIKSGSISSGDACSATQLT